MTGTDDSGEVSTGPLLEAKGVTMRFEGVTALAGVDFLLGSHEIHALMGENGAGKSTLIKCLTGVHTPTTGAMKLSGQPISPVSPRDAERLGIAAVFQEVGLIPNLSVAENICLGREPVRRWWPGLIDWRKVHIQARTSLDRLGLCDINLSQTIATCSVAIQQLVAIARALNTQARVLILDEPTSSLDRRECESLFAVLRRLRSQGLGIIFISHFLDQVYELCDRITVLRDGKLIGSAATRDISRPALISQMVGRAFDTAPVVLSDAAAVSAGEPLLSASGLGRRGALEHVDVAIHKGQTVGLAGLLGSGRTETARIIAGADVSDRGVITYKQQPVRFRSPREAIAKGIAFTPENRKAEGVVASLSVLENIVLALRAKRGTFSRLTRAKQWHIAQRLVTELGIKTSDLRAPISTLSGGNQQKALLARWFAAEPDLLILDEPTRGIDVVAKADILRVVERMRSNGMSVLFISSELEESVRICTRIVVLRDRRSVASLEGNQITENAVLSAVADHA